MVKTIMFIGAGKYQAEGIKKAKEMGLKVVAVDRDPDAPGFKIADIHAAVDVTDIQGCLRIAKENKVDGVLTIASDVAVPSVAAIAKQLGLPGISPEVAKAATNKGVMRGKFFSFGVPSPKFQVVSSMEEAKYAIERLGLPCVMKPTDSSASKGVTKITEVSQIEKSFDHAYKNSKEGRVLVEEFILGIECTVEAMTYKGETEILAISSKKKPESSYQVATDLTYPPNFPREKIDEIKRVVKLAIKSLGIDFGPSHTEVMVSPSGVRLVETAARGGGFGIFSRIIPLVSGVDAITASIKMSLGETPDIKPKYERAAVLRFFAPQEGILKEVKNLEEAKSVKDTELGLFKKVGDVIPPLATDGDRTGYVISWGETREEAIRKADLVEKKVKFVIERARS